MPDDDEVGGGWRSAWRLFAALFAAIAALLFVAFCVVGVSVHLGLGDPPGWLTALRVVFVASGILCGVVFWRGRNRSIVVGLILATTVVFTWMWVRAALIHERDTQVAALQAQFERFDAVYQQERRAVAELGVFSPSQERDAGAFLNPHMIWPVGANDMLFPPEGNEFWLPEGLHAALTEEVMNSPLADIEMVLGEKGYKLADFDSSWMKRLLEFDHWDWERNSPRATRQPWSPFAPLPMVAHLMSWTKIRLLQGESTGDLQQAAREARHLVTLFLSNETLLSAMVSTAVLAIEDRFHGSRTKQGVVLPETLRPISSPDREMIKRVMWASLAYHAWWTPERYRLTSASWTEANPVDCIALFEAAGGAHVFRDGLQAQSEWYAELTTAMDEAYHCRLLGVREHWGEVHSLDALGMGDWACQPLIPSAELEAKCHRRVLQYVPGIKQINTEVDSLPSENDPLGTPFHQYEVLAEES